MHCLPELAPIVRQSIPKERVSLDRWAFVVNLVVLP